MQKPTIFAPRQTKQRPCHTAAQLAVLRRQRDAWLKQVAPGSLFHPLFDLIPNVYFFAKNRRGQTMFSSRNVLDLYGMRDEGEMLGLTDFDLNPDSLARGYVSDDHWLYKTGQPILNRMEVWFSPEGVPDWFIINKLPIRSRRGTIIGVMGILQPCPEREKYAAPWGDIADAVRQIRESYAQPFSVTALAEQLAMSERQLQRKFRDALGMTPRELLLRTRINAACRLLKESDASVAAVALQCGFYDQSSLTRLFHQRTGMTPMHFRRRSRITISSRPKKSVDTAAHT
jgi:AraC-like DNA-binding protein